MRLPVDQKTVRMTGHRCALSEDGVLTGQSYERAVPPYRYPCSFRRARRATTKSRSISWLFVR